MSDNYRNPYELGLDKNTANFTPLTTLTFIERAALVYPDKIATVHGRLRRTWAETYSRCRRLALALQRGVRSDDTVAVMLPNLPEMSEVHFGVPMAGVVLRPEFRLDAETIAFMLQHGEAKLLLTDREFSGTIAKALKLLPTDSRPVVIDVDDPQFAGGELLGEKDYEALLAEGDPDFAWDYPADEWQSICLNYTSGTTGNPKGVVYHHRGAYLDAVCNVMSWGMGLHPVYLWTLPMFHCNGWCFPWSIAAAVGANVALRHVRADAIFDSIRENKVNHFCGAPTVMNMLSNAPAGLRTGIDHVVKVFTGGAPPPAAVLESLERMGFDITHAYGLTRPMGLPFPAPGMTNGMNCRWNSGPGSSPARGCAIRCWTG